jgi:AraC-like DNA-binding protein
MMPEQPAADRAASAVTLFDTGDLPRPRRFQAFRDFATPTLGPDYRLDDPAGFECLFRLFRLGSATGFEVEMSRLGSGLTADMSRAAARIAEPRLVLHLCGGGTIGVAQGGREAMARPGDALVAPLAEGAVVYEDGTRFRALLVHMDEVAARLGAGWSPAAARIAADDPHLALLRAWLASGAETAASADVQVTGHYETVLLDLVALTLGAGSGGPARRDLAETSGRLARAEAILRYIAAHAARLDLRPAEAAAHFGCSERYLRKLLESRGTSFSEHLLACRLQSAHARLRDMPAAASIAEIARSTGFADVSYFYRTFRRRFGCTPQDVRAADLPS